MARRVFYSFHYEEDASRAAQVRNMGVVEGNEPATGNEWEAVKRGGDAAIRKWIDGQLYGKSCCIVLIGQYTASRRWVLYEIEAAWNAGKGVVGVRIHGLKGLGTEGVRGPNPLDSLTVNNSYTLLSSVARTYDPWAFDSKGVYAQIRDGLPEWIDEAIAIRARY